MICDPTSHLPLRIFWKVCTQFQLPLSNTTGSKLSPFTNQYSLCKTKAYLSLKCLGISDAAFVICLQDEIDLLMLSFLAYHCLNIIDSTMLSPCMKILLCIQIHHFMRIFVLVLMYSLTLNDPLCSCGCHECHFYSVQISI